MSNLSTCIAAALEAADQLGYGTGRPYTDLADAVIAELDAHGWLIDPESPSWKADDE